MNSPSLSSKSAGDLNTHFNIYAFKIKEFIITRITEQTERMEKFSIFTTSRLSFFYHLQFSIYWLLCWIYRIQDTFWQYSSSIRFYFECKKVQFSMEKSCEFMAHGNVFLPRCIALGRTDCIVTLFAIYDVQYALWFQEHFSCFRRRFVPKKQPHTDFIHKFNNNLIVTWSALLLDYSFVCLYACTACLEHFSALQTVYGENGIWKNSFYVRNT